MVICGSWLGEMSVKENGSAPNCIWTG